MKNRYGVEYSFAKVEDSLYQFRLPEREKCLIRIGGRGEAEINMEDIGFFDPSGGPFVEVGSKIYCDKEPLTVTRIMIRGDGLFVKAE